MKFKKNDKVVFSHPCTPNNLVMNVSRGNFKSSGMDMVKVDLPGGAGIAYAESLRLATSNEIEVGTRL